MPFGIYYIRRFYWSITVLLLKNGDGLRIGPAQRLIEFRVVLYWQVYSASLTTTLARFRVSNNACKRARVKREA
jgi:hypothetical protein